MATLQREDRATVAVSPRALAQARDVHSFLTRHHEAAPEVTVDAGRQQSLTMPHELAALVLQLVDLVSRGATVTVGSIPDEVTTTVAASMLGISRPSLMKLVRDKKIPAHKVGTHTRLKSKDVLALRRSRFEEQRKAFDELRELEQELDALE